jgi:uncharacterized membrane protein
VSRTALAAPRWAVVTTFLLSLVGLGLSTYLTVTHFEPALLICNFSKSVINCAKVTTSAQSYFLGVPVAILGLGNFVVMTALNSPWAWRAKNYWVHVTRFVLTMGAMCFVLWLVSAELLIIKNICLYCTGVHLVTFALFVVLTYVGPTQLGWTSSEPD